MCASRPRAFTPAARCPSSPRATTAPWAATATAASPPVVGAEAIRSSTARSTSAATASTKSRPCSGWSTTRTAPHLALIEYADKSQAYILAPDGLKVGDKVVSTNTAQEQLTPGLSLPLRLIPPATFIHCIEIEPGKGGQLARSAGGFAQLLGLEGDRVILRMPSGEQRYLNADGRATVGIVGNVDHHNASLGKAGRNRWKGRRPRQRGMSMNPVDHPNGGGGGKKKGGGGRQHLKSPWGQLAKGFPTRTKAKASNNQIIVRRNGRKVKQV